MLSAWATFARLSWSCNDARAFFRSFERLLATFMAFWLLRRVKLSVVIILSSLFSSSRKLLSKWSLRSFDESSASSSSVVRSRRCFTAPYFHVNIPLSLILCRYLWHTFARRVTAISWRAFFFAVTMPGFVISCRKSLRIFRIKEGSCEIALPSRRLLR